MKKPSPYDVCILCGFGIGSQNYEVSKQKKGKYIFIHSSCYRKLVKGGEK